MIEIRGIPAELWVNRTVKVLGRGSSPHGQHARVQGFTSSTIVVLPAGHKKCEHVPADMIHPNWSQNPDLMAMRHRLTPGKPGKRRKTGHTDAPVEVTQDPGKPESAEPAASEIRPESKEPSASESHVDVDKVVSGVRYRLVLEVDQLCPGWEEDVAKFRRAHEDWVTARGLVASAVQALEEAERMEANLRAALDTTCAELAAKGMAHVVDKPLPAPEPAPAPVPAAALPKVPRVARYPRMVTRMIRYLRKTVARRLLVVDLANAVGVSYNSARLTLPWLRNNPELANLGWRFTEEGVRPIVMSRSA